MRINYRHYATNEKTFTKREFTKWVAINGKWFAYFGKGRGQLTVPAERIETESLALLPSKPGA